MLANPWVKMWKSSLIKFAPSKYQKQKVNKHPNFDDNFDTWCQLEQFEYELNKTKEREKFC